MRDSPMYVPLVELRSCKRMASCRVSTAQCTRDTSGSSISISAPPPDRPMVTSGRESSHSTPCDGPPITEILIVSFCGRVRLVVCGAKLSSSLEARDLSCGTEEFTEIVGGPGFAAEESRNGTIWLHFEHRTWEGRWFANCASSKSSFAPQLGQGIRIFASF